MSASAIYEGFIAHRRFGPVPHGFRYRVFMPFFDLDELPELLDPIPALVRPSAGARALPSRRLSRISAGTLPTSPRGLATWRRSASGAGRRDP